MLELLVLYSCPIVITGDLNIHLDDPDDVNTICRRAAGSVQFNAACSDQQARSESEGTLPSPAHDAWFDSDCSKAKRRTRAFKQRY